MRRSKLELYEDILTALANKRLTVDAIAYACNMDCVALRKRLDFLRKSGLVEKRNYKTKMRYGLTSRGIAIHQTLTITRRLKKLQKTVKDVDKTLKMIPAFEEYNEETPRRAHRNENY